MPVIGAHATGIINNPESVREITGALDELLGEAARHAHVLDREEHHRHREGALREAVHEDVEAIPESGASDAMIPLGGGVQIIADIPSEAGAVVDIGSGIQAEKTREEALEILSARNQELLGLMDSLKSEFDETEELVIKLATQFNEGVADLQDEAQETQAPTT